ncbi:MAG TPA: hypothetical protein VHO01_06755 [Jatrophihabitans sp.]|nr:hypothetical protein [Jatrophihabitans sp.]
MEANPNPELADPADEILVHVHPGFAQRADVPVAEETVAATDD